MTLLKCTFKKSVDVAKKWMCVFVACIVIATAFYIGMLASGQIVAFAVTVWMAISSIPLWVTIPIIAIIALVGYSFVWCVSREFDDNDWNSNPAASGAITCLVCSVFIWIVGWITAAVLNNNIIIFVLAVLPMGMIILSLDDEKNTCHVAEFPGALWHYMGRKNE